VTEPFVSDGCTGFFDVWRGIALRSCCETHDVAWYERPGDWLAWAVSNVELAACFWQAGAWEIAILGFLAVSTLGALLFSGAIRKPGSNAAPTQPRHPAGFLFARKEAVMADFKTVQPNDPPWLKEAFKLLGLTEGKGAANNPEVLALYAEAGFSGIKADSVAWCAAFKGAMLRRAGYRASGSLAARSYLDYGEEIDPDHAKRGDTAIFKRGTASWQGHVGDLLRIDANTVWVIGGNQSLKGTDGAVTITALPRTSLLGVRRPTAADKLPAGTTTLAKPRKAPVGPSPAPFTASLVEAVQKALIGKGYHEVGEPDGKSGPKTRGAILAFEADNELELVGKPSPELLAAILASDPRPVAETRAEGVPADNRVVKDAGVLKTIGGVLTGGSILGGVGPMLEKIEGGAGMIARLRTAIEPLVDLWPLLAVAGGIAVFWYATRARAQVVEDYQSGKLAR